MKVNFNHNGRRLYRALGISDLRYRELDVFLDQALSDMMNPMYGNHKSHDDCTSKFLERIAEEARTPEEIIYLSYNYAGIFIKYAEMMKDPNLMMKALHEMLGIPYQKQAPLTDDGMFFKVSMS